MQSKTYPKYAGYEAAVMVARRCYPSAACIMIALARLPSGLA
jgi:hypothetical protein